MHDTREMMDSWLTEHPLPSEATLHGAVYIRLHSGKALRPERQRTDFQTYVLIHEADYGRYLRCSMYPFHKNIAISNVYRPGPHGAFYSSLIRNGTSFKEIKRFSQPYFTPELALHRHFWGAYPEFVGDTVLYEKQGN